MNICEFSPDKKYRYTLWRRWNSDWDTNYINFIGLNPSTADETRNDPTIRKCLGFAKRWGYSGMCMTNIFAFRATKPTDLKQEENPTGLDNQHFIISVASSAKLIIVAWGNHGKWMNQDLTVLDRIQGYPIKCLKQNKNGSPMHPLYVPYDTPFIEYRTR
jgi:hypothetical protein